MYYTKTDIRNAWKTYSLINFEDSREKTQANRMATAFFKFLSSSIPRGERVTKEQIINLVDEFFDVIDEYYPKSRPGISRLYRAAAGWAGFNGVNLNRLIPKRKNTSYLESTLLKQ